MDTPENTTETRTADGSEPLPFIETALSQRIWRTINSARKYNRFAFVFGESQIGKTAAVEAYAERFEDTVLVRMPSSPTLAAFSRALADKLGAPAYFSRADRMDLIFRKLTRKHVLIIDEAHQAIATERRVSKSNAKIFELIREIHDVTRCGVCLVATNILRDAFSHGQIAGILQQTVRRSTFSLLCPDTPLTEDLARFAAAYGLLAATDEALELQTRLVEERGLGMWLTLMRMAATVAAKKKRPMTWGDVGDAVQSLRKIEGRRR